MFGNRQALRAHLRVHRGEYRKVDFLVACDDWEGFKRVCAAHGLTTCHLLGSFVHGVVAAFRKGGSVEFDVRTEKMRVKSGLNPMNVNIYQTFQGKPRSRYKKLLSEVVVTKRGTPSSCAFCEGGRPVGREIRWEEDNRCVEYYVCAECYGKHKRRGEVEGFKDWV